MIIWLTAVTAYHQRTDRRQCCGAGGVEVAPLNVTINTAQTGARLLFEILAR